MNTRPAHATLHLRFGVRHSQNWRLNIGFTRASLDPFRLLLRSLLLKSRQITGNGDFACSWWMKMADTSSQIFACKSVFFLRPPTTSTATL